MALHQISPELRNFQFNFVLRASTLLTQRILKFKYLRFKSMLPVVLQNILIYFKICSAFTSLSVTLSTTREVCIELVAKEFGLNITQVL